MYALLISEYCFFAGAAAVILCVKPHNFYLLFVLLAWWSIKERRLDFLSGFVLFGGLLAGMTELLYPGSWGFWFERIQTTPTIAIPRESWATATLAYQIRALISALTGHFPFWPCVAVPGITAIIALVGATGRYFSISWREHLPVILCISLFTGPFTWVYDMSVLLIVHLKILSDVLESNQSIYAIRRVVLALGAVHAFAFAMIYAGCAAQHHYFWIAPAYCCFAAAFRPASLKSSRLS
jgi:hypothetical protein